MSIKSITLQIDDTVAYQIEYKPLNWTQLNEMLEAGYENSRLEADYSVDRAELNAKLLKEGKDNPDIALEVRKQLRDLQNTLRNKMIASEKSTYELVGSLLVKVDGKVINGLNDIEDVRVLSKLAEHLAPKG